MIGKKNHSYLPASIKPRRVVVVYSLIFLTFGFLTIFPKKNLALAEVCISYATCHYQSGTGLACPPPAYPMRDQPFQFCQCVYSDGACYRSIDNACFNQSLCDSWIQRHNLCSQYGDCCGCSGKPRPIPSPTPKPRPTPTPTPKPGTKACHQSCETTSECSNGLSCGYNASWGERRCHNPSCPSATDCKCSWQR